MALQPQRPLSTPKLMPRSEVGLAWASVLSPERAVTHKPDPATRRATRSPEIAKAADLRPRPRRCRRARTGGARCLRREWVRPAELGAPKGHGNARKTGLFFRSGCPDLNRGPLVPQTSALTRLRHTPSLPQLYRHPGL